MGFGIKIKEMLKKYKHAWVLLYFPIYLLGFFLLEHHVTEDYRVIHLALDDKIPFIEYFIVPYLLWFVFIAVIFIYFFFKDTEEFYRLVKFMFAGMTLFLVISALVPNGLNLRPTVFERDNIFVDMVKMLYRTDTPTNVFPSIHVYNSVVACVVVHKSKALGKKKGVCVSVDILGILIILSTMFLKQHSVIDVAAGIVLAYVLYPITYAAEVKQPERSHHFSVRHHVDRKRSV